MVVGAGFRARARTPAIFRGRRFDTPGAMFGLCIVSAFAFSRPGWGALIRARRGAQPPMGAPGGAARRVGAVRSARARTVAGAAPASPTSRATLRTAGIAAVPALPACSARPARASAGHHSRFRSSKTSRRSSQHAAPLACVTQMEVGLSGSNWAQERPTTASWEFRAHSVRANECASCRQMPGRAICSTSWREHASALASKCPAQAACRRTRSVALSIGSAQAPRATERACLAQLQPSRVSRPASKGASRPRLPNFRIVGGHLVPRRPSSRQSGLSLADLGRIGVRCG